MEQHTQAPASAEGQTASVELQQPGMAPGADGAPAQNDQTGQPQPEGEEGRQTPEHRKAAYRFSELTRQTREAELRAVRAEAEVEAYRRFMAQQPQAQPQNAAPEPAPAQPLALPNAADFPHGEFDPGYQRALARYEANLVVQEEREARQREAQQAEAQQALQAKAQAFRGVYAKVQEAGFSAGAQVLQHIGNTRDGSLNHIGDAISSAQSPEYVAEYLGRNPAEYQMILTTRDPIQQALLIGRIDQHIANHLRAQAAAPPPAPPPPPAQPAPTPTVGGRGGAVPFNPDKATYAEFEAWRKANPHA